MALNFLNGESISGAVPAERAEALLLAAQRLLKSEGHENLTDQIGIDGSGEYARVRATPRVHQQLSITAESYECKDATELLTGIADGKIRVPTDLYPNLKQEDAYLYQGTIQQLLRESGHQALVGDVKVRDRGENGFSVIASHEVEKSLDTIACDQNLNNFFELIQQSMTRENAASPA